MLIVDTSNRIQQGVIFVANFSVGTSVSESGKGEAKKRRLIIGNKHFWLKKF